MITLPAIREAIATGQSLKIMASVYSELAVTKLGRIRSKIERNREFALSLATVYGLVEQAARQACLDSPQARRETISLLLTSNHPLYGGLEMATIRKMMESVGGEELLVVGRSGQERLVGGGYAKPFTPVALADDLPRASELAELVARLASFERIRVFHPRFATLARQEAVVTEIGVSSSLDSTTASQDGRIYYIFEPEVPKIREFFHREILRVLLEQAFLEAELSRAATRLLSMDETQRNADEFVVAQKRILATAQKHTEEMKVLELTLGFLARKKLP